MTKRDFHKNFIKYINEITKHSNYEGLQFRYNKKGMVSWLAVNEQEKLAREKWWKDKAIKEGIKIEGNWKTLIAVKTHPTKKHTCQICGDNLSINYIYPNVNLLKKIVKYFNINYFHFDKNIYEILMELKNFEDFLKKIKKVFNGFSFNSYEELILCIDNFIIKRKTGLFSPGVMGNSPDRFDGFHSYGACCRVSSDKGRNPLNMATYGEDRRAYENWVEGDWRKANKLMSLFPLHCGKGMSADHIGPISLGFCHRPKFNPMSKEDNSSKGNRMSYEDVVTLIEDEKSEKVMSWYGKYLWDELKNKVSNKNDSEKLSNLLSKNTLISLTMLSLIYEKGFSDFLIEYYLNPQYAFFKHEIIGFNPIDGSYNDIKSKSFNRKEQYKNHDRYIRIAFDSLKKYSSKTNRKNIKYIEKINHGIMKEIFILLEKKDYINADKEIKELIKIIGKELKKEW